MFFQRQMCMGSIWRKNGLFVSEGAIVQTHLSPGREKRDEMGPWCEAQAAFFRRRLCAAASFFCSKAPTCWMFRATTARAT